MKKFFNPSCIQYIPIYEVPQYLNLFFKDRVRLFTICTYLAPSGSIKVYPGVSMVQGAWDRGALEGKHTIVASSSGNYLAGLVFAARTYGNFKIKGIIRSDVPREKEDALHMMGVDCQRVDSHEIEVAEEWGQKPGFIHLNQYDDSANPRGVECWLAPYVYSRVQFTVCFAGLGTGGTAIGFNSFIKKSHLKAVVVGVYLLEGEPIPGMRTLERLQEVKNPWQDNIYDKIGVNRVQSYKSSFRMHRYMGLLGGPSSGSINAGALMWLAKQKESGTLDKFRNEEGEVLAVMPSPDTLNDVRGKYSTFLDSEDYALEQLPF